MHTFEASPQFVDWVLGSSVGSFGNIGLHISPCRRLSVAIRFDKGVYYSDFCIPVICDVSGIVTFDTGKTSSSTSDTNCDI